MTEMMQIGKGRLSRKTILYGIIVLVIIALTALAMVTVSRTFDTYANTRHSYFVTMPSTPISKSGTVVALGSVSPIIDNNLAVGVQGYLTAASGQAVVGASVYVQYYLEGDYRTQVATTDSNGFFQIQFPMNWTGWLPLTVVYFGDTQHQGFQQVLSLPGESV